MLSSSSIERFKVYRLVTIGFNPQVQDDYSSSQPIPIQLAFPDTHIPNVSTELTRDLPHFESHLLRRFLGNRLHGSVDGRILELKPSC